MSERNYNKTYDWWSESPQEGRSEDREESILDLRWNRSMNKTNEMLEEEEVTKTLQRTRKTIRVTRRNGNTSDSETRHQSRVEWQLSDEQQKRRAAGYYHSSN